MQKKKYQSFGSTSRHLFLLKNTTTEDPENSGSQWIAVTISGRDSPDFDFTAQLSPAQLVSSTSLLPSAKESGRFTTANANHPVSAPCLLPYSIKQQHHLHYSQQSSSLTIQQTGPPVRKNTVSSGLSHNKLSALQQTLINRTLIDFPNGDKNFNVTVHGDDNKNCCACGGNCSEDQVRHVHSCVCRVITGQQNEKAKCNSSSGCEQVKQNWRAGSHSDQSVAHSFGKMPLQRAAMFQLGMLLMVVPLQFLITKMSATTESQRVDQLRSVMKAVSGFSHKYLSWNSWQKWSSTFFQKGIPPMSQSKKSDDEENLYTKAKTRNDYFATSTQPRSPRPSNVHFRVGQVIKHKIWGYRGVIIGWDEVAVAPVSWMNMNHPPDKPHWRTMPNYSILVDTRDRLPPQITYVPQENIEIASKTQIFHPEVEHYFEKFDGDRYLPQPSVRRIYPYD